MEGPFPSLRPSYVGVVPFSGLTDQTQLRAFFISPCFVPPDLSLFQAPRHVSLSLVLGLLWALTVPQTWCLMAVAVLKHTVRWLVECAPTGFFWGLSHGDTVVVGFGRKTQGAELRGLGSSPG